jgi:putative ABC transport system ATP-binding protein
MLELHNLQKSYPGNFEPTLKDIYLRLNKGEFCIIIGSNGSGKSTLMRTISGESNPDSGKIVINEHDVSKQDRSQYIACVTQDVSKGTIPEMTLLENIVLSQMRGKNGNFSFYKKKEAKVISIIKSLGMGLETYLNEPLQKLSGGQKQIIATLMAVSSKPEILLLDEHTSALDPKMQKLLMKYTVDSVTKYGITTMMITHKLDDAATFGDRLIMLHQGRIVLDVQGKEKKALEVDALLALFHKYEDLTLKSSGGSL